MEGHSADELAAQGAALLEQGDATGALACFSAGLRQRPDDLALRCYEIAALLSLSRYSEALTRIDAVLADAGLGETSRANVLVGKANALAGLQRWDQAEVTLVEALSVLGEHANGWLLHGDVALRLGRPAAALESYRRALAAGVADEDRAHLMAGWSLLSLQRYVEAEEDFFGVMLRQGGRMPEAFWGMAMAAQSLGETPLAIQYLEQFIQLNAGGSAANLATAQQLLEEWRGEAGRA
jgi:tetratricopeptide (TPR) repeat protein